MLEGIKKRSGKEWIVEKNVWETESSRRFCCKRVHFGENRLLMITVKIMLSISL